jgi:putative two-component system response regulator
MHGRIVAIADVFDALTNDRVYRAAMPLDDAVALMREQRGHHFDPRLLDLFLASTDRLEEVRERLPDAP